MIGKCGGAISLVCTALLLAAPQAAAQDKKTLTISSWGGAFQKAQKEAWFGIVEKELEHHHQGGHHLRYRRRAHAGRLRQADLGPHDTGCLQLRAAREGRHASRSSMPDHEGTDAGIPRTLGRRSTARSQIVYSVAIGWRDKAYRRQEAGGLGSVLGHEELPRPALRCRKHPIYALETALIADGVPMDKLYPLDVDRAFKKLEQLKPHVLVWWSSGAQSAQVLKDGEVDMVGGLERPHPGARERARGQRRQDRDHLQPADHRLRLLADPEGRAQQGTRHEGDRDHDRGPR